MNRLPPIERARILHFLCEGNSIRAVTRLTGASKTTVTRLLVDAGQAADWYQDRMFWNLPCKRIQLDEIWGFVGAKERNKGKLSGLRYTFEIYRATNGLMPEFRPVSGIYMFCRLIGPGKYEALYVGEADSLYNRLNAGLRNHDGFKRASRIGTTHVAALLVGDVDRVRIETDLRHGLNPVCNRQPVPLR